MKQSTKRKLSVAMLVIFMLRVTCATAMAGAAATSMPPPVSELVAAASAGSTLVHASNSPTSAGSRVAATVTPGGATVAPAITNTRKRKRDTPITSNGHSKAEFAYISGCLFMHTGQIPTPDEVLACIKAGNRVVLFDGVIGKCAIDYDEAYFHDGKAGFARDNRKVDRGDALGDDVVSCIIKFRRGLGALEHASPKLIQPVCKSLALHQQLVATFEATRGTKAEAIFAHPPTSSASTSCKTAADEAYGKIDSLTAASIQKLKSLFGHHWNSVYKTYGLKSRLWAGDLESALVWLVKKVGQKNAAKMFTNCTSSRIESGSFKSNVDWVFDEFEYRKAVTLLSSDSVVTRLDNASFKDDLKWLVDIFDKDRAVTFMSNVASRISKATFKSDVKWLVDEFGEKYAVKIMKGSVACRIGNSTFKTAIAWLIVKFGKEGAKKFICGGVACRIEEDSYKLHIMWLIKKLKSAKLTVTFMCGSAAKRLEDQTFKDDILWLIEKFGEEGASSFMCGAVAENISNPDFKKEVLNLISKYGKKGAVSIMNDGVGKRLLDKNFREGIHTFVQLFGGDTSKAALFVDGQIASRMDKPKFIPAVVLFYNSALAATNSDTALKMTRKIFCVSPYVRLYNVLPKMMDEHGGAVGLISYLDKTNGKDTVKNRKKWKAFVDSVVGKGDEEEGEGEGEGEGGGGGEGEGDEEE